MTQSLSPLTQFRVETQDNSLVHLVFDRPDRSMSVFSNKAIHELGAFAEWLHRSDAREVLVLLASPADSAQAPIWPSLGWLTT